MTVVRIPTEPAERGASVRAILAEYARVLSSEPARWVPELTGGELPQIDRRGMRGAVWSAGAEEAAGLALWDLVPGVGRRVWLYLREGHRTADSLRSVLDELDERSDRDGPIASVLDFLPGVPSAVEEEVLSVRGFFPTERVVLRLRSDTPVPEDVRMSRPDLRPLTLDDRESLVGLMREAYDPYSREPVPALFYRDPRQDAADAVEELFSGGRGEWLPWASFAVDAGRTLCGVSIVTQLEHPILSEVMVAPSMRRIGLGTGLALESVHAVREHGSTEIDAVVSSQDLRSLRLFRRLGFEAAGLRAVGFWVNRVAIGAVPPPSPPP